MAETRRLDLQVTLEARDTGMEQGHTWPGTHTEGHTVTRTAARTDGQLHGQTDKLPGVVRDMAKNPRSKAIAGKDLASKMYGSETSDPYDDQNIGHLHILASDYLLHSDIYHKA